MPNDFDDAAMSEAALADWNRPEEDAAWAHLQDAIKPALTPMLQRAIEAAKALPEEDQDALAAEILEWIEDERRWSESFARTHDVLAELAREALAEHYSGETLERETDGTGARTAALTDTNGDGRNDRCTQSGSQARGTDGDQEFHARLNNNTTTGLQTVVFCSDANLDGCTDESVKQTIRITWTP